MQVTMFSSFIPDNDRPLCSRPYLIPLIYLISMAASLLPAGKIRAISGTAGLLFLCAQVPKCTTGNVGMDNLLPIQAVLVLLHWIDFFILHSPNEFVRTKDRGSVAQEAFWGRLRWTFDLHATMRGIGWNWKVKNVPDTDSNIEKWTFVRREFLKTLRCYITYDICCYLIDFTSYRSGYVPSSLSGPLPLQVMFAWLPCIGSYASLNLQYHFYSALTVAIGIYTPKDWPPLMGSLDTFTTIREVWGKFWHQLLRRKLNLPYKILTRYIPIQHGTIESRYAQLYLAFITSAFIHQLGALNVTSSSPGNDWLSLLFFLMQPIAIMLEDFAIYVRKKAGVKSSWKTKTLRTVCTLAWFSYSFRFFSAFYYGSGMFDESPIPSLIYGTTGLLKQIGNVSEL